MNAIGGYFELELEQGKEFHHNAIRLNTGRNALEYILRAKKYKKAYLPYFTCDVMLEPINKMALEIEFYSIDETFRPVFDFSRINGNEVFIYTNYFGISDSQVSEVALKCENLIIDNSQSFFSNPLPLVDTFYSPRKYFGVPDGAYLYTNKQLTWILEQDISYHRFEHLLGRIEFEAEKFYDSFKINEASLVGQSIKKMSKLTRRILESINYQDVAKKRIENFNLLHNALKETNKLNFEILPTAVPMVYPYLADNGVSLREKLISNRVFVPTYWPNVLVQAGTESLEYNNALNIVALPVDQRYSINAVRGIINIVYDK